MAEKLSALSIRAFDQYSHLIRCQHLIALCLEEDEEASCNRVMLLLECYQAKTSYHFDELRLTLEKLMQRLEAMS